MARNDPTDTGGLFIGRRPGTAPLRLRARTGEGPSPGRRRFDEGLAALIFLCQVVLCISLWGPVPLAGIWIGSQVVPFVGSEMIGILIAFVVIMISLVLTLVILRRLDHVWKLVRRAAGHDQSRGALEPIFVTTAVIATSAFLIWFFIIAGPGSSLMPERPS
jgi:uncharacterized membrane protein (DUF485 family)